MEALTKVCDFMPRWVVYQEVVSGMLFTVKTRWSRERTVDDILILRMLGSNIDRLRIFIVQYI